MKNIRWMVLGYLIAIFAQGCDGLMSSEEEMIGTQDYDRGCCSWNPIYVKVVE